jgi:hypothetical protein
MNVALKAASGAVPQHTEYAAALVAAVRPMYAWCAALGHGDTLGCRN